MIESILTKDTLDQNFQFKEGVMMLVDKPMDWTSFDVVNKIRGKLRYHLQERKIKVGHAGTLDPMATGLLLVCVGKYTKQIESLQIQDKSYTAEITLGATTPSYDAESEIDQIYPTDHVTLEAIQNTLNSFLGDSLQTPPMYSAIKINGQTLYKLARKGKEVHREPRPIRIDKIDLLKSNLPNKITIEVDCSKGTYIRSLAYDIGKKLKSGAYLSGLRRTSIGSYHVDDALDVNYIADWLDKLYATP